ncbi:MAG: site-specific DNA-methyltransferase [Coprococcus comes]
MNIPVYSPRSEMFFTRPEVKEILGCLIMCFPNYFLRLKTESFTYSYPDLYRYYREECVEAAQKLIKAHKDLKKWYENILRNHSQLKSNTDYAFTGILYQLLEFEPFRGYVGIDIGSGVTDEREGDNLHSLKLLEKTHKGKVDVIYIDPPYNTGNKDFIYNDEFVGREDSFRHSTWLSFLSERLRIAHKLLSPDGLIFVSIDDNEQAQLKLLMDEIFSEDNFIICMPRITKKSGKTTSAYAKNHDYILVYTKREQDIFVMEEHVDEAFKYEDEYVRERGKYKLNQTLDYDSLSYSSSLDYPLEIEGEIFYPGSSKELWEERQKGNHRRADWAWRWSKKLFQFGYDNGFVVIKRKKDGSARIYTKTYLNAKIGKDSNGNFVIEYNKRVKATSSLEYIDNKYSNDNAKKDLSLFGLGDKFDYSKPVELIKKLIKAYYKNDALILDFFAGSGTTAQAVLELNEEDGGSRRFIVCTNNENNICQEVTYQRIKTVLTGRMASGSEYKKRVKGNLKYYRTDFVDKNSDELVDELLEHIVEMIQLEYGVSINNSQYLIVMDDDEMDDLETNYNSYKNLKAVFLNQDW